MFFLLTPQPLVLALRGTLLTGKKRRAAPASEPDADMAGDPSSQLVSYHPNAATDLAALLVQLVQNSTPAARQPPDALSELRDSSVDGVGAAFDGLTINTATVPSTVTIKEDLPPSPSKLVMPHIPTSTLASTSNGVATVPVAATLLMPVVPTIPTVPSGIAAVPSAPMASVSGVATLPAETVALPVVAIPDGTVPMTTAAVALPFEDAHPLISLPSVPFPAGMTVESPPSSEVTGMQVCTVGQLSAVGHVHDGAMEADWLYRGQVHGEFLKHRRSQLHTW